MLGRPTKRSKKLEEIIFERIIHGEGIAEICRDDDMPDKSTVFRWLAKDKAFCDRYARVKAISADHMAEEMLDIADNAENDWMKRNGKEDEDYWQSNGEHIQRSRLRIDTRKWLMAKLKPKKYGDKLALAGDEDSPLKIETITRTIIDPKK